MARAKLDSYGMRLRLRHRVCGASFGPVMWYYKTHPIARLPGVLMITLGGAGTTGGHSRRSVIFPRWIASVYAPALSLRGLGHGTEGLGGVYRSYLFWCMDRKSKCYGNLSRLDAAKRKWASDTKKADGDTPFVTHICDLLPERAMLKCPTGGDYVFNLVGARPECTFHGSDF
jgi:hypothetical protein